MAILGLRSSLDQAGVLWPAVPSVRASRLLAVLLQLQASERWPGRALQAAQQRQLDALWRNARANVPFYRDRYRDFDRDDGSAPCLGTEEWYRVPELHRGTVQRASATLRAAAVPQAHGKAFETRTSGSTGEPVAVLRTQLNQFFWEAAVLREHVWHGRDAGLTKAVIRANGPAAPAPNGRTLKGWGLPFDKIWRCGPAYALDMATDVAAQAEWLRQRRPAYLLTYPTNLAALLDELSADDLPGLRQVICVGESVTDELRRGCLERFGAKVVANYSSQEMGYMALECPDCGQYHVQSETVVLEVLSEAGQPCREGEVGRIVVTDLHNFAMPVIRYAIGDYAEVGTPCSAGRGLPSLKRIVGRERNMVVLPDGARHWPLTGFHRFGDVAPIRQFQFVQRTREQIEVRLVCDRPLTAPQKDQLGCIIKEALGHPFQLEFRESERPLARSSGGKFEEFVSLAD